MSTATHAGDESAGIVAFEWIVRGAIVINTVVLIWSFIDTGHEEVFEPIHTALLLFFVGELLFRLHRTKWNIREFFGGAGGRWNIFDSVIVAVSLLPLFISGMDTSLLRVARLARITHSVRHVGHLRLAQVVPRPAVLRLPRLKKQVATVE